MTRNVTTTYRYQRPPRRKQAVALEVPAVVTVSGKPRSRPEKVSVAAIFNPQRSLTDPPVANDERVPATSSHDDTRSAVVTIGKPGKRFADVPDSTPEEQQRRADAADALWREPVRWVAGKDRT
jgi:hypothetical protein